MLANKKPKLTIILVLIIGFGFSFAGAYFIYKDNKIIEGIEAQKDFSEFENTVDNRAATFYQDLELNFEALRSIAILFSGDKTPSQNTFNQLSESIIMRHGDIQAFSWIPRVTHKDRAAMEKKIRKTFPNFQISQRGTDGLTLASNRSEYFPVYYIHPHADNKRALGFDLASDSIRLDALEKARDSGELKATASITLVQEKALQKGFLVFLPLYSGPQATPEERKKSLTGFITSVYRIGDIFNRSAWSTSNAPEISFKIVEKNTSNDKKTIYLSNNTEDIFDNAVTKSNEKNNSIYFHEKELNDILGQKWVILAVKPHTGTRRKLPDAPILFFAAGAFFSIFIAMYIRRIANQSEALNIVNGQLDALSHTDGLTGISNRRTFDEFVEREWLRAARNKRFISILIIDVDYFKPYNDNYGHALGDQVLKKIAASLKKVIKRPGDLVARYGGEEFVIMLPDTEQAESIANSCTQAVRDLKIPHEFSDVAAVVTVSVGLETCLPDPNADLQMIVENADKALYLAKESGRNRVMKFTK